MYYPLISTLIVLLSSVEKKWKILGLVFQFLLVGSFYFYTSSQIKKSTGSFQFSPLSSWKIANNALYMMDNLGADRTIKVPKEFIAIDTFVQKYLASPHYVNSLKEQDITNGSYFIFMKDSPLNQYMASKYGDVTTQFDFFRVAPYFNKYGNYLIRNNPVAFFRFVIWPNFQQYLVPNTEIFNSGDITLYYVQNDREKKFVRPFIDIVEFRSLVEFGRIRSDIFKLFPTLFLIVHLSFMVSLLMFLLNYKSKKIFGLDFRILFLVVFVWFTNLVFAGVSAPSVLRFELFISIVEFSFMIYFWGVLYRLYQFAN
jgi:hypothetical protein